MKKQSLSPFNNKNQAHGLWLNYYNKGNLGYKGQYVNDKEYGYWIQNWTNKPEITLHLK